LALVILYAVVLLVWTGLAAVPDTHEDSLVYHWAAPEAFLRAHSILSVPDHHQWQYPLGVEMLYTLALSAGGIRAIKAANLAVLFIALMLVASLARRLVSREAAVLAVSALALSPAVAEAVWLAKTELGLVVLFLGALVSLEDRSGRQVDRGVTAGIFLGMLAGAKYTSIYALAGFAAWLIVMRPRKAVLAALVLAMIPISAIWPARNWLVTGNPLFPHVGLMSSQMGWSAHEEGAFRAYLGVVSNPANMHWSYWLQIWRDLLASPQVGGLWLALFCIPGLLLLPGRVAVTVAVPALAMMALLAAPNSRFVFFPLVGLFAVVAAAPMEALSRYLSDRKISWDALHWAGIVLGLPLLLGSVMRFLPPADVTWLTGQVTTPALWRTRYGNWDLMRDWASKSLPAGARLLMIGESRRIGFRQPVTSTHPTSRPAPWRWSVRSADPAGMMKAARQEGVAYLVYNLTQASYRSTLWYRGPDWNARQLAVYRRFAREYVEEVHRSPVQDTVNGFFYVFRLGRRPVAARGMLMVLPSAEGLAAPAVEASLSGKHEIACRMAETLVQQVPDVAQVRESAGVVYQQAGQWQKAEEEFRLASLSGFAGEAVDAGLATNELNLGRPREAFPALARAFRYRPDYREQLRTTLAVALLRLGWPVRNSRPKFMRECMERARVADPARYEGVMKEPGPRNATPPPKR